MELELGNTPLALTNECLWQLAQSVGEQLEVFAAAGEAIGAAESSLSPALQAAEIEPDELCITFIDHMNDGKGYSKKLAHWAEQLGLRGMQFARTARSGQAGRLESAIVMLHGSGDGIGEWLTRLRTQYVDVNSKGLRCKERKSNVLSRHRAPDELRLEAEAGALQPYSQHIFDEPMSLLSVFQHLGLQSVWESCVMPALTTHGTRK
eukprot:g323.t1